jgi:O-antigen/teichoic acid export membrane protein
VLAKGVLGREIPAPRGDRIPLAGMWAEVWRFMLSTNLSGLFSLVTKESDVFFLGMFAAPATVGRYRLARTVAQFVMLFGDAIVGALYPQAVRLAHESTARLWRFLRRVTSGLAAAVVPGVVVTVVFAEQILAVAGGDEFQGAAGVLRVLVCGFGIATVLTWSRPAMLALGRPHAATVLNAVLAVGQLAATLVLVPRFGIMATAWITASLYATGTIVLATAVRQAARDGTAFETRRVASDPG